MKFFKIYIDMSIYMIFFIMISFMVISFIIFHITLKESTNMLEFCVKLLIWIIILSCFKLSNLIITLLLITFIKETLIITLLFISFIKASLIMFKHFMLNKMMSTLDFWMELFIIIILALASMTLLYSLIFILLL